MNMDSDPDLRENVACSNAPPARKQTHRTTNHKHAQNDETHTRTYTHTQKHTQTQTPTQTQT